MVAKKFESILGPEPGTLINFAIFEHEDIVLVLESALEMNSEIPEWRCR